MKERVQFTGWLVKQTELARLVKNGDDVQVWIPKSMFLYWRVETAQSTLYCDRCIFSVEPVKQKELTAIFDEV